MSSSLIGSKTINWRILYLETHIAQIGMRDKVSITYQRVAYWIITMNYKDGATLYVFAPITAKRDIRLSPLS
jgi:hypothetical protein